jgi:hypothetical protein
MFSNEKVAKSSKSSNTHFECRICSKTYKDYSGLWRHKKKCQYMNEDSTQELIQFLMKENNEFKQLIIDQNRQMSEISRKAIENTGHCHINSHNKTFNLQVFLNETCKNAINMSDFIQQINVSISDLEDTGKLGYTEGISKIFINGLKQMDISDRPLHCSNLKRETIYIKNNNEWTKDNNDNVLLVSAIKEVSNKNIKQISEWQKLHPDFLNPDSKENDKYMQIVLNSMSGSTKEESDKNYEKIAKNVIKKVVIEK